MINFVLCDDNDLLLSKLHDMLESIFIKYNFNAEVSFSTTSIHELINFVNQHHVDVLFLDIDLNSDINGIDLAKFFRKKNSLMYLIFITGHFEYIISAYECKTFDFIQKPFSKSKLESTVTRLFNDLNGNHQKFIKLSNNRELVSQNLINYIQKDGMKTIYNTDSGVLSTYGSFNSISANLPSNFVRCHKSYIVNLDKVTNINLSENTIFFSGSRCFIGPKYKNKFVEVLNKYGTIK